MDERIATGVAALVLVFLIAAYVVRRLSVRKAERRMSEIVTAYFNGDLPLDELARRSRELASWSFIGGPQCQALVQAAFQRAAETKLAGAAASLDVEKKLMNALADLKSEFGLPERYKSEGWRAGRE